MNTDDLTYQIRGAIFEVNKVLGYGFLEKVYENALMVELKTRGLKVENQIPINVEWINVIYREAIDCFWPIKSIGQKISISQCGSVWVCLPRR